MILVLALAALTPTRVHAPPALDGKLDDAMWQRAGDSSVFTQSFPDDGKPPTDPTRVLVTYDDNNIYIGIDCTQSKPRVARLTRRDREVDDDHVAIELDTAHDRRSAFHFQVSAAGVLVDGLRYDDTSLSTDWDDVWHAEVAETPTGWSAEIRIPFRVLRLHAGVSTWGFQVRRWTGASGEIDTWAYAPRDAGGEVSRYGDLGPFDGLEPRGSLALIPFALTRFVRTDPEVPSAYGDGMSAAAGLDLTWRPARNVAVSAAVLPDFAQVEADQIVVNLTTTEIEYPEKRPFFLQGLDLFQTPIQMLYTRRIGRPADDPVLPDGTVEVAPPGPAPVLGAAKAVASVGPVDIAALSAITGGVDARLATGDTPALPAATHHALRVRAEGDGDSIGMLATVQTQHEDLGRYPMVGAQTLCPDGTLVAPGSRCGHDAIAGGVDGSWRSDDGAWTASGQAAATQIDGGPPRMRPDGTIVKPGDSGAGTSLRLAKEGGTLRAELNVDAFSRRFDIDDLGYQSRANVEHAELDLEAYTPDPGGPLAEARSRIEIYQRRNLDGLRLPSGYQWNVSGTGKGLWEGFLEVHWRPAYFDDRELGDGRALERSGRLGIETSFRTNPHRDVVAGTSFAYRATGVGQEIDASGSLDVRPRDNVELGIEPDFFALSGEPRFVDGTDPMGPRFARQDATSFGVTTRATWTPRRDLTLQVYVQALLATIRYRDAFIAGPALRAIALGDLMPTSFDPAIYDTREGVLNATAVARWEYAPGSTAYVVYSHAQIPLAGASYVPSALVHGPASDVVLVKLSWAWLR